MATTVSAVPDTIRPAERFRSVRSLTETLAEPLSAEDQTVQSMADVSPTKWHRAHVTWFFETFLLEEGLPGYREFHPRYRYLFNSYYESLGDRFPRPQRGLLSRPGIDDIAAYRRHVDAAMDELTDRALDRSTAELLELGMNHEQQHQELLLMDIKHVLSLNPLQPAYRPTTSRRHVPEQALGWWEHPGGVIEIGYEGDGFCFDNERPRHATVVPPFALADRPVSCGDWLAFIDDGGYRRPELWLSEGWAQVVAGTMQAPLYWSEEGGEWRVFTLGGAIPLDAAQPVCHISYYEADAYARWAGARLPTEAEWETAVVARRPEGHFLDLEALHPRGDAEGHRGLFGEVWEWTSSAYLPYPGFKVLPGAVGEYNGKFMVNQHVLRGGCAVTPSGHARATYRNFFPPPARWPFTGARLAKDL